MYMSLCVCITCMYVTCVVHRPLKRSCAGTHSQGRGGSAWASGGSTNSEDGQEERRENVQMEGPK